MQQLCEQKLQREDRDIILFSLRIFLQIPCFFMRFWCIFFGRISLEMLDAELQWLISRTRSVEESFQRDTELLQQLDSFLQVTLTGMQHKGALCQFYSSRLVYSSCWAPHHVEHRSTWRGLRWHGLRFQLFNRFSASQIGRVGTEKHLHLTSWESLRKRHYWVASLEAWGWVCLEPESYWLNLFPNFMCDTTELY